MSQDRGPPTVRNGGTCRRGSDGAGSRRPWRDRRAQSHVVGVSLMIGLTVLALGALTMTIGSVVESGASSAEADRVADAMAVVADPADVTGTAESELRFGDGRLFVEQRSIRLIDAGDGSVIEQVDSDAFVYEVGSYSVVGANGAVLHAGTGGATMRSEPSIVAARDPGGVLVVGAPSMDVPDLARSAGTGTRIGLRTAVEHDRRDLGEQTVRVAVETEHPRPWAAYFERRNATVVDRSASFDGDDVDSVVAEFEGERQTYLVVHEADLEVGGG